ncbi:MAG: biopolymer transporter ExbD [Saprospiraceae bacterium]|nr:biopolymer transporter ExbD [Saprospiraceae bacterium]
MAEFQTNAKSPHIDMTPMVDLGFLLITFFMLASSFAKPKVIKMTAPADGGHITDYPKINCNRALTLLLDETDKVKYYTCPLEKGAKPDSADYSREGLRTLILQKQEAAKAYFNSEEKELFVLLKATEKAHYKHLIDAIDELNITHSIFTMAPMEAMDSTYLGLK